MELLLTYLKGMVMGAADIVPGVSGGTMALITGIYERLVAAIDDVGMRALPLLLRGRFREAVRTIDWELLVPLVAGILTSIFSLSRVLSSLLASHPVPVWSFFTGLIVASVVLLARDAHWGWRQLVAAAAATATAWVVVGMVPVETPTAWWFTLLSGALASIAMILPGISGSFILVLLSQYRRILEAVHTLDITTLAIFTAGVAAGLVAFSRFLRWLLAHHRTVTMAVLIGFMAGSVRKIWPFKDAAGSNVLPSSLDNALLYAIMAFAAGFVLVWLIDGIAKRRTT